MAEQLKSRLLNLLIALDQLGYVVITLGRGSPDETMSAAAWRTEQDGRILGRFFRPVLDAIFRPWGADHCFSSYQSELTRKHLPTHYGR